MRRRSQQKTKEDEIYRTLKATIKENVHHCARCGLYSAELEAHHPYKRGTGKFMWKQLVIIPLCRSCHSTIHDGEKLAREDGWLVRPRYADGRRG